MHSKVLFFWFYCLVWLAFGSVTAAQLPPDALEQARGTPPILSIAARSGVPIATTREEVAAMGDGVLKPFEPEALYPTDTKTALWLKLRFALAAPVQYNEWQFDFQQNYLDKIELHVQSAQGQWIKQTTGDHIASVDWPVKGLYPRLAVPALPAG